jgi:hypothetical protein
MRDMTKDWPAPRKFRGAEERGERKEERGKKKH